MAKKTTKTEKSASAFDYKKIKSFSDACKKENINPEALPDVSMIPEEFAKAILAVYKLFIIFKAINNGWEPNWNDSSQYKYFPWFYVDASEKVPSGFGFSYSDFDCGYTDTYCSSRLCTDTSEKARYMAAQFESEYKDFLLNIK